MEPGFGAVIKHRVCPLEPASSFVEKN